MQVGLVGKCGIDQPVKSGFNGIKKGQKTMELGMYLLAAKRTLAPGLSDKEVIEMCGLGLIGEIGEVADMYKKLFHKKDREIDKAKVLDELGDVAWYIAVLAQHRGLKLIKPTGLMKIEAPASILFSMAEVSGSIAVSLRAYLYEREPFDNHALTFYLCRMLLYIASFAKFLGSDLDTVMFENVEKLKIRHKLTFNSEYTSDKSDDKGKLVKR